jgi:hypothetical protein
MLSCRSLFAGEREREVYESRTAVYIVNKGQRIVLLFAGHTVRFITAVKGQQSFVLMLVYNNSKEDRKVLY